MDRLKDKVAIITGSTGGIGLRTAELFASEGAKVVVTGRRVAVGEEVAKKIRENGGEAIYHPLDIGIRESIETLFADTEKTYGKIDVLVNNAANLRLADGRVDEITDEMWDDVVDNDLKGPFWSCRAVLPYMRKQNGGSIVNIGSMASVAGDLGATAYACAKAGVELLTESLALQYGKENIRCNCIRPGLIVHEQNESRIPQTLKDIFLDNIMVNRYGCPDDIAYLCLYLASDESSFVTGQIMTVDGGLNAHVTTVAQFRNAGSRTW